MVFKVNNVDMLPYVDSDGFKWQRNDLDGESAGRTLDGIMHRERVAVKIRLDINCKPLTTAQAVTVLNAILPEFVQVEYTDPMYGRTIKTMYSNNAPASVMRIQEDGTELWNGISFPLIER